MAQNNEHIYFNKGELRNDNIFTENHLTSLSSLTGMPVRSGLEQAIISNGKIVNVVSEKYGHLPNEVFYTAVEAKLAENGIGYDKRSINRDDRSFSVDYILNDESIHVNVKNGVDKIRPMLSFVNSYDGSSKSGGHFGFFREVCSNGLHVAHQAVGFSVRHYSTIQEVVIPEISELIHKFINNEFFSLHRKFEVLAERPITNIQDFVKDVCGFTSLFNFYKSDKNPEPGKKAEIVMGKIDKEAKLLHTVPNMWIGYNAFNAIVHEDKKGFDKQKGLDEKLFNTIFKLQNVLSPAMVAAN